MCIDGLCAADIEQAYSLVLISTAARHACLCESSVRTTHDSGGSFPNTVLSDDIMTGQGRGGGNCYQLRS